MFSKTLGTIAAVSVASIFLTGCAPLEADIRISVSQDAKTCELSSTKFAGGVATFVVQNIGDTSAEFYILKDDASSIVSEVDNIGPGLTRELTVELASGKYWYSCEQMDGGKKLRGELEVTAATAATASSEEAIEAIAKYKAFVDEQAKELLAATESFVNAVKAKDVATAKANYPSARAYWERIEPVAESFGDLDPKMDAREGDLDEGIAWTGWHALEKQLWVTGLDSTSDALADQLLADTKDLVARIAPIELTLSQIANGSKELMDEVATGKVTGEEERYSHTDLWDFAANVEGAQKVVEISASILAKKDEDLLATLQQTFEALNSELALHAKGSGYKLYTELTDAEIKSLASKVEAVSEPLANLTAALVR